MWKFTNLKSGHTPWPPDDGQQENSVNPYGCSFSVNPNGPLPGFGTQGNFTHFNSCFYPPLNPVVSSEQEAITQTKRFLIFDHSKDQTSLVYSSVANPFEGLSPPLPPIHGHDSNCHDVEEEEIHENTEEINALLYSDSEYIDDDETSTGHSPFDMVEEDITSCHFPTKRRRVDATELDTALIDTASSAIAPCSHYIQEDDNLDQSFVPISRSWSKRNKQERIQQSLKVMRKIIPGGKGKDTASVLDAAIQYLKLLKLREKSLGASSSSL